MTTIVIRDVPPEVHDVLVKRAASEGRSLQQYTLRMISEAALRKTQAEVLAEIRRRAHRHPEISNEQIVAGIRADREGVDDPWQYVTRAELMGCPLLTTDAGLAAMAPNSCRVELV